MEAKTVDVPALTLFESELQALGILECETRFVPGAPDTSGTYVARSVIYDAIGQVSGRSAIRELVRLRLAYANGTKWLRITEAGARFAANAKLHTTRRTPGRWETLVAGRQGKPAQCARCGHAPGAHHPPGVELYGCTWDECTCEGWVAR